MPSNSTLVINKNDGEQFRNCLRAENGVCYEQAGIGTSSPSHIFFYLQLGVSLIINCNRRRSQLRSRLHFGEVICS